MTGFWNIYILSHYLLKTSNVPGMDLGENLGDLPDTSQEICQAELSSAFQTRGTKLREAQ